MALRRLHLADNHGPGTSGNSLRPVLHGRYHRDRTHGRGTSDLSREASRSTRRARHEGEPAEV